LVPSRSTGWAALRRIIKSFPNLPSAMRPFGYPTNHQRINTSALKTLGGSTVRLLLIVEDPASVVTRAVALGASEVSPIADEHGWLLGRIEDPFGHHWEIGRPLAEWPPIRSD